MIIGINGKAGAGKDTVADYLVDKYGFTRYAFADALRDVALAIDPILSSYWSASVDEPLPKLQEIRLSNVIEHLGWDSAKRTVPEVRRLLQVIGTEAGRQVLGENVWVDIVKRRWIEDGKPNAVVTDMRFPNEFELINKNLDEVTLKVVRPNNPNAIPSTHASEQYEPDCLCTIVNNGTLDDLYRNVDSTMEELREQGRF